MGKLIEVKKLKIFRDKEGKLFETLRADDKLFKGKFGQNLVSFVNFGVIKGLHLHKKQTEYTSCIKGNMLYVAIKEGKKNIIERMIIGEENPVLIRTDPGIWHGYTPTTKEGAIMLYTMDRPYNPRDTDTREMDPYSFGDIWGL